MEVRRSLRHILLPTLRQSLGCLAGSLAVILVVYHGQIWQRLSQNSLRQALQNINYGNSLSGLANSPLLHTAVIVLFWGGVGLVAYTIIWSLINVAIEARNEVVLETSYTNRSNFVHRLNTPLLQVALAATLFVGLYLSAKLALPFWLDLAFKAINTSSLVSTAGFGLGAVLGMAGNAYVLIMLGQLVFWVG